MFCTGEVLGFGGRRSGVRQGFDSELQGLDRDVSGITILLS